MSRDRSAGLHGAVYPALRLLPPEAAHDLVLWSLAHRLGPRGGGDDEILRTQVWGRHFRNPIGIAAGFDKNAVAIDGVLRMGFGFHEVGGVTPAAQPGNPKPRLFRLAADGALINRMGFNNDGLDAIADRLAEFRNGADKDGAAPIVGINLAANADSADPIEDFIRLTTRLSHLADFVTVDISCPNTANGQLFLEPGPLGELLAALNRVASRADPARPSRHPPRLIKLAPDIEDDRLKTLIGIALEAGIDGMIVANTSRQRPPTLTGRHKSEAGGLSGRPIFERSTRMLARAYRETEGRVPLIGVGGVAGGADAYAKIRAGASLVQLYTGLVFAGPALLGRIKRDLAARLRADGFETVADAVGADHRS